MSEQPDLAVRDRTKRWMRKELAKNTRYNFTIGRAAACIAVFVDKSMMYNDVQDHQSMGDSIQHIPLATHALGFGAMWLGEVLKKAEFVQLILILPEKMELMAVVAVGYSASNKFISKRRDLSEVLPKELRLITDALDY